MGGCKEEIPLSVPCLKGNEWNYVKECLDTNWVSYVGPFVKRFEKELAAVTDARRAVAMSSGTAALHVALILAGVKPDEEVVMPALTFIAPANAIRYCGAWPALIDVRGCDWQMDIDQLSHFLSDSCIRRRGLLFNKITGRRVAALLPVHLLGAMCDVDAVAELATMYELPLIEDAAECLGATYKSRPIGASAPSYRGPLRIVVTSFNGNKVMTTGGGGALLTNENSVANRAMHLSTTAKVDDVEFLHDEVGYNYRLTNIAAALGVAQLEQLNDHVEFKRMVAHRYKGIFLGHSHITTHPEPRQCRSTFWLYTVLLDIQSKPIAEYLNSKGIMARRVWLPISDLPPFKDKVFSAGSKMANHLHEYALSIPCSVEITPGQIGTVAEQLMFAISRH